NRANALVAFVDRICVRLAERSHRLRESVATQAKEQVVMIGHQAICDQVGNGPLGRLFRTPAAALGSRGAGWPNNVITQFPQEKEVVLSLKEDGIAIITTIVDVIVPPRLESHVTARHLRSPFDPAA